jgi:hypothetical protein
MTEPPRQLTPQELADLRAWAAEQAAALKAERQAAARAKEGDER